MAFCYKQPDQIKTKNKSVENVLHYQMCKTEIQNLDLIESISFKNGLNATSAIINAPNLIHVWSHVFHTSQYIRSYWVCPG